MRRRNHQENPQTRGYGRRCLKTPCLVDLRVKGAVADGMNALNAGDAVGGDDADVAVGGALDVVGVGVDAVAAGVADLSGGFDCDQCYCGTFGLSQKIDEDNGSG